MTMVPQRPLPLLKIAKYPNRRFYDSTRRAHVTLDDIYQLIVEGYDVEVVDSRTGDDITNVVLTQILLDRDPPKLELLPASVLHYTLRSNRQVLRAFMDRFFGPMLSNFAAVQKQLDQMLRQSSAVNPMMQPAWDWAERMMRLLTPEQSIEPPPVEPASSSKPDAHAHPVTTDNSDETATSGNGEGETDLRREVEQLRRVVEQLQRRPARSKRQSRGPQRKA